MHAFFYLGTFNVLLETTKTETLLSPQERKINVGFIFLVEVRIIIKEKRRYFCVRDIISFLLRKTFITVEFFSCPLRSVGNSTSCICSLPLLKNKACFCI
jgi:hypothetical protein